MRALGLVADWPSRQVSSSLQSGASTSPVRNCGSSGESAMPFATLYRRPDVDNSPTDEKLHAIQLRLAKKAWSIILAAHPEFEP